MTDERELFVEDRVVLVSAADHLPPVGTLGTVVDTSRVAPPFVIIRWDGAMGGAALRQTVRRDRLARVEPR